MSHHKNLNIDRFFSHKVIIWLSDGTVCEGLLVDGLVNEDWKEDGEREMLALQIEGIDDSLEGVYLDEIEYIAKRSDVVSAKSMI